MENVPSFLLGLILFGVSILSFILFPILNLPIYSILHYIGILINMLAGALLLMGGFWNRKKISGPGLIIGIIAWTLLIISNSFGTIFNANQFWAYAFILIYLLDPTIIWGPYYQHMVLVTALIMNLHQTGNINCTIQLWLGITSVFLGSVSYGIVVKKA
ncbi:MAG: hypothetical protein ACTSRG_10290 [Candidatus Helarchaeota archaeon]